MRKRVFELAKELGIKSPVIINFLKMKNIEKNSFSKLEAEEIDLINNKFRDVNSNNWLQLTEEINNPNSLEKEKSRLDSLFGSSDYWVLAKIVKKTHERNEKGLIIKPKYILNDTAMEAFNYRLINDFSDPSNENIFKLLSDDEIEILEKQTLYGNKYYKIRLILQYQKDGNKATRFSFTVVGMECIGDRILLDEFLLRYKLNEKCAVYRLLDENISNATNKNFILCLEEDVKNLLADYKKEFDNEKKLLNSKLTGIKKEIKKANDEYKETKDNITRSEKYYIDKVTATRVIFEQLQQQKEEYESWLQKFKLIQLLKLKTDLEKEKDEAIKIKKEKLAELQVEYNKKKRFLDRYNVILSPESLEEGVREKKNDIKLLKDFTSFDKMIDYAQKYLYKNDNLTYAKDILKSFYLGLQTNQLILLMGKPGTGKTSLVKKIAEMFGFADAAIIPVQSNWSDKGDLLGYYNPLEKNYITTQFLDSLLEFCKEAEKEENKEKLFFICLDEMNLAHIEYYFAEFLSILQGDKRLRLYSKKIKEDIIRELKYCGFTDEEIKDLKENHISLNEKQIAEKVDNDQLTILKRQYYLNLCRMANMIANVPDEITIPERIKFIGTLNQDATTLDISPKVLDRSYVIRINDGNDEDIKLNYDDQYSEKIRYLPVKKFAETNEYDESLIKEALSSIRKITYYSQRICKQTFDNESFSTWCKVIGTKSTIDYILAATFLPRLRIYSEDKEYNDKERELEKLKNNHDMVAGIVSEIKTDDGIDFWRS